MLDVGLVKGYRGFLYFTPLYHLANGRADGKLRFDCFKSQANLLT